MHQMVNRLSQAHCISIHGHEEEENAPIGLDCSARIKALLVLVHLSVLWMRNELCTKIHAMLE